MKRKERFDGVRSRNSSEEVGQVQQGPSRSVLHYRLYTEALPLICK